MLYFLNQGHMLRFLSGRSVDTGRRSVVALLLFLQLLAVVAVAGAGWIGRAMVTHGLLAPGSKPDEIFMVVAHVLTAVLNQPGVFGLVLAALTAALMSTADTLINASASVWVNDVWRLYVRPKAPDAHHLKVGRIASMLAAGIGLAMVPIYHAIGTIYQAHGAFTAAVGPPMAVALMLGLFWKRFTPAAAFWTMLGGLVAVALSFPFPRLIEPFAMGVQMDPSLWKAYSFQRALFGLVASLGIGVVVSFFSRPRPPETLVGLVAGTMGELRRRFKGAAEVNESAGHPMRLALRTVAPAHAKRQVVDVGQQNEVARWVAYATPRLIGFLDAQPGDLVSIADSRLLFSDLRGGQARLETAPAELQLSDDVLAVPSELLEEGQLEEQRPALVRRIL